MPELMENILNNINDEIYTLHSCALVSRHWCKMTIPILWQDPFGFDPRPSFISNYFSSLGEYEKIMLKRCGIKEEFSKTIFDYARFLKVLKLWNLKYLNIESATTLLRALAKNATQIKTLKFREYSHVNHVNDMLPLINSFMYIIKSQEQLRIINLVGVSYLTKLRGIISALESQKNSLQEVRIDNCDFNTEFEVLNNCKNLETLRIMSFYPILSKMSKILDYKISTLELNDYSIDARPIALMLKKSGILLQRLSLVSEHEINEEPLLLEAIKSFCPNITCFRITNLVFSTQLIELIGNLQKLRFLSL
ncbi:hypothetical protein F8M41_008360 [Gigaspora margarita]|uniref:F-box domain-containing protein n=1 Tax=Gigaspora margarita TaxID=4874 RepID=A0A8H3X536_GIGMA|nr:hypothetical protein F8M41_008360 [Gigaspora margarita]